MGRFVNGDVVVAPFPFSDLSASKISPVNPFPPSSGVVRAAASYYAAKEAMLVGKNL